MIGFLSFALLSMHCEPPADLDEARRLLVEAGVEVVAIPNTVDDALNIVRKKISASDWESASRIFREYVNAHPDDFENLFRNLSRTFFEGFRNPTNGEASFIEDVRIRVMDLHQRRLIDRILEEEVAHKLRAPNANTVVSNLITSRRAWLFRHLNSEEGWDEGTPEVMPHVRTMWSYGNWGLALLFFSRASEKNEAARAVLLEELNRWATESPELKEARIRLYQRKPNYTAEWPESIPPAAAEFLNKIRQSAQTEWRFVSSGVPFADVIEFARVSTKDDGLNNPGRSSPQLYGDVFTLRAVRELLIKNWVPESIKSKLREIEPKMHQHLLTYLDGFSIEQRKSDDELKTQEKEDSHSDQSVYGAIGGSFLNTYATSVTLLNANIPHAEALALFRRTYDALEDKYAVPYDAFPGNPSQATRRGASARAPLFYNTLYRFARSPAERALMRAHFIESVELNFVQNLPALYLHTVRPEYGDHAGEHHGDFTDAQTEGGIAPAYLYAAFPFVVEGIEEVLKDPELSATQREKLKESRLRLKSALSLIMLPTNDVRAVGRPGQADTATFSKALGGLALIPYINE